MSPHLRRPPTRRRHPAALTAALATAGLAVTLVATAGGPAQAGAAAGKAAATTTSTTPTATATRTATTGVIPVANGAWTYDNGTPGQFASSINAYNAQATAGHQLNQLFPYATDMEMYCPGNKPAKCTPADLQSYYTPGSSGWTSTEDYATELTLPNVSLSPIIDGRTDTGGYLIGFNQLSEPLAHTYADQVAAQVCADPRVSGIQFDIEPFNVTTHNGQYYFYMQIAKDFAGMHTGSTSTDPYGCVSSAHPEGRYFSVFTFASSIQPGTAEATNVAAFTAAYRNGYVIDSLYDLGTNPAGSLNDLPTYQTLVTQQTADMKAWADAAGIPYSFGIPAAASVHEYETCTGTCVAGANGTTGNPMTSYDQEAVAAIKASGAPSDSLFRGTDLWDFGTKTTSGGATVTPYTAQPDVLSYLATTLPG